MLAPTAAEQPPHFQAIPSPLEATKEPSKAGDQGRGPEVAKGKEADQAGPSQRTKARARSPLSRQRSSNWSSPKPWPRRRRLLIFPSSYWSAKKTLPLARAQLRVFFFLFLFVFSAQDLSFFLCTFFFLLGQFALVHDALSLLLIEKILLFAFVDLCFSCNVYLWLVIIMFFHALTKASSSDTKLA